MLSPVAWESPEEESLYITELGEGRMFSWRGTAGCYYTPQSNHAELKLSTISYSICTAKKDGTATVLYI